MKKSISEVFKNCTVSGDTLIEYEKEDTFEHNIAAIFKRLDGIDGLTITIKKDAQYGAITKQDDEEEGDY